MNKEKLKSILSFQIPPKILNAIGLVILLCLSCFLFLCNVEAVPTWNGDIYPFISWCTTSCFWYSFTTLAILWGILYCLTRRLLVSFALMEVLTVIWGFSNRVVYYTRNQFVSMREFKLLVEAGEVKVNMNIGFQPIMVVFLIVCVILGILLGVISSRIKKMRSEETKKNLFNIGVRIVTSVILFIFLVVLHSHPPKVLDDNMLPYKDSGTVLWFCQSLFNNVTQKLSEEEVLTIYDNFVEMGYKEEELSEKRPNVIAIMSESFWDVNNMEGVVKVSNNPMDKYYEIAKNAISGEVAVNIFGGGTDNSEFEFLTGINSKYLINLNCYKEYYTKEQGSMVSYMKELGYYTMALHSYDGKFWGRNMGYENMGFDVFYDEKLFRNREMSHGYISDSSLTKEIIERFEEQKEINSQQPVFSFSVSVQNHVTDLKDFDANSGSVDFGDVDADVIGTETSEINRVDVEEYYNGLCESIDALEELLNYFENYEEDTMIIFFGDHAPSFLRMVYEDAGREIDNSMYRTPYMIWTNYENDYESYGDFNLSYLSTVVLEYLAFPKPQQYYMNKYMLENCVIDTRFEQIYTDKYDKQKKIAVMNSVNYLCDTFPEKAMALPYWEIVK